MFARIVSGALLVAAIVVPAKAENMNADEARKFIAGKMFAFNCFDGTKGIGRILDDGSAQGNVQFGGNPHFLQGQCVDKSNNERAYNIYGKGSPWKWRV